MLKDWEQRLHSSPDESGDGLPPAEMAPDPDAAPVDLPPEEEPAPEAVIEPIPDPTPDPAPELVPEPDPDIATEPTPDPYMAPDPDAPWVRDPLDRLRQHFRRERLHRDRRYTRLLHPAPDRPSHTRIGQHPARALEHMIWRRRRLQQRPAVIPVAAVVATPVPASLPSTPPPPTPSVPAATPAATPAPAAPPSTPAPAAAPAPRRSAPFLLLALAALIVAGGALWWWWNPPAVPRERLVETDAAPPAKPPAPAPPAKPTRPALPPGPSRLTVVEIGSLRDAAGADLTPVDVRVLEDALQFGRRAVRLDAADVLLTGTIPVEPRKILEGLDAFHDAYLAKAPDTNTAPETAAAWQQEESRWLGLKARAGTEAAWTTLQQRAATPDADPLAARLAAVQLLQHAPETPPAAWVDLFRDPATYPAPGTNALARLVAGTYADAYAALYRRDLPGSLDLLSAGARSDAFGGELAAACLRAIGRNLGRAAVPELRNAIRAWEERMRSSDIPDLPGSPSLAHLNTGAILNAATRELLRGGDDDEEKMMRDYLTAPWKEAKVRSLIELGNDGLPVARRPLVSLLLDDPATWDLAVENLQRDIKLAAIAATDPRDLKVLSSLWTDPDDEVRHRAAIRWRVLAPKAAPLPAPSETTPAPAGSIPALRGP